MKISNKSHKSIIMTIICTMLLVFLTIFVVILRTKNPPNLQIGNVDISNIKDGVYVGSADNGLVNATVSVEVNNGMILSITILEHEQLLGKKAEKIIDSIIELQSLEVDAISSATYSSDTL